MQFAPIVLFVYNRPWHTRQTLEALSKNALANQSELFVFADGPKISATEVDLENIKEVRSIVKEQNWCKTVNIIESDTNKGLANSIIEGVTKIVNEYGKIIVLEDDLITSFGFLKFMNDALNVYEYENRVMHISGYMYPVDTQLPQTYFLNTATCWGWATWARAWKYFESDANVLRDRVDRTNNIRKFNIENGYDFYEHLKANTEKRIHTWAIKWYATIFLNKGFSLHPYPSLTNNIGHDGQGVHCGESDLYTWKEIAQSIEVKPQALVESKKARKYFAKFFKAQGFKIYPYDSKFKYQIRIFLEKLLPNLLTNSYYRLRKN